MIALTRRAAGLAAFALLTAALASTAGRPDSALSDGKADGTLTVNGKVTKVAFAYARSVPDPFDSNAKGVLVIVSDVALDAKALGDDFARIHLSEKGKLHALEITLDGSGKPIAADWRHDGFKEAAPSGLSSADVFTKKTLDDKNIEGGYKSASEHEFFGSTFSFDVTFRAAIGH